MDDVVDLAHAHCNNCFNLHCTFTDDPVVTCEVVQCEQLCGARYHQCKQTEHKQLCPLQRVPCINAVYGCTASLVRSALSSHLTVCPASVIHCTMEWNRWPVYSSERQSHQPTQILSHTDTDQLDIALALRDQRMLTKSMRASRKTRQILTNSVNRKHPAVPLDKQLTNLENVDEIKELEHLLQTMQEEKSEEERRRSRSYPGLRDSICSELIKRKYSYGYEDQHEPNGASGYDPPYYPPEVYDAYPYIHCSHCDRRKERLERILGSQDSADTDEEEKDEAMDDDRPEREQHGATRRKEWHHNGCSNHVSGCEKKGTSEDGSKQSIHDSPKSQHSSGSSDVELQPPALFVTSSTTGDLSAAPSRGYAKLLVIQPQNGLASFGKNGHSLGLDLSMESITRYQAKPDSMYTFLCAQEFRRDEFANHFKNVHSDIHGGLNGWLEQRCPLAPYGCTYSQRRLYPGMHGAKIVHSQKLESFGIQMEHSSKSADRHRQERREDGAIANWVSSSPRRDGDQVFQDARNGEDTQEMDADQVNGQSDTPTGRDHLSSLPFELLQYLFRFLDSFSLCNSAMVSKLLRQICSSLLEERGMVVLLWEKQDKGWQVSYKAWLYSTAFSPVHSWGFENYAPIGQHLKTCPYNVRSDYPDKVQVMGKEAAIRKKKLTKKEPTVNEI